MYSHVLREPTSGRRGCHFSADSAAQRPKRRVWPQTAFVLVPESAAAPRRGVLRWLVLALVATALTSDLALVMTGFLPYLTGARLP